MQSGKNFFEPLETRRMMSASASINQDNLEIYGTDEADQIIVEAVDAVRKGTTQIGFGLTTLPTLSRFHVKVMDAAGNVRTDAAGKPIDRYFDRSGISYIYVYAGGGSDNVNTSNTAVTGIVYLGSGNDVATTGRGADVVYGEAGNDYASLGDGNDDYFNGSTGSDTGYGGAGNDILLGEGSSDVLYGEAGNDELDGGSSADELRGGDGNDILKGGSSGDDLFGNAGKDRLYGASGADELSGGSGDDYVSGGTGIDELSGGSGRDGLLGGPTDDPDQLSGGTGQDRFLEWSDSMIGTSEPRSDYNGSEDAVMFFRDNGEQDVTLGSNIGSTHFSAGTWRESEIEAADGAFVKLQNRTSNVKLLKTNLGWDLTFHRAGSPTTNVSAADTVGGWNSGIGNVTFTEFAMTQSVSNIQRVITHEIGHNWDDENPFYGDWKNESGWENNIPLLHDFFPPEGKVKSDDGGWWRDADAEFARGYGKMNPLEDWSTMWEAYFNYNGTRVSGKIAELDKFFDHMSE